MPTRRVVITGRGAVSPYGLGVELLIDKVWQGCSGVRLMPDWQDIKGLKSYIAAPVPAVNSSEYLPRSLRRTMGDMAVYAVIASREAVEEAGLDKRTLTGGNTGVAIGSTTGSPGVYEEFYKNYIPKKSIEEVRSGMFFKIMGHSCAANVCLALGIRGEQWAPASACTSAAQAIGLGYILIQSGRQEIMLCGGADETNPTVTMVFDVIKAASRCTEEPLLAPRPFDSQRDGVVCGGGSGILVLESLDSARKRGANILGEIRGFGLVNGSRHIANPDEETIAKAMNQAIAEAGISHNEIDYVNAHATGTILGDIAEGTAIRKNLGDDIPVSSFKGHLGHTLGAAGSLETIVVFEMLARQEIVPTLHLENLAPELEGMDLVQGLRPCPMDYVLKTNFALGGVNTALLLKGTDKP
ncbi:MAG: beta-ketoacyl-[acyl-carrier-protein] synthase family protein [Thermodesulfobacteriota bacterium]